MRSAILLTLLCAAPPTARAEPRRQRIAVIVDTDDKAVKPVSEKLAWALQARAEIAVFTLEHEHLLNPVEKKKLVAVLKKRDIVVPVGNGATDFATRELGDKPIYFVGATTVRGERLGSGSVGGILAYNIDRLLDAMKALRLTRLGLAFTPGYEPVADWIRRGSSDRGMDCFEREIAAPGQVVPAVRDLIARSQAIWPLGDPLVARGAGFEFLQERALARRVGVVDNGPWGLHHGALLAFEPDADDLAAEAADALLAILGGQDSTIKQLRPGPRKGVILLNGTLASKWNMTPPQGEGWRIVR